MRPASPLGILILLLLAAIPGYAQSGFAEGRMARLTAGTVSPPRFNGSYEPVDRFIRSLPDRYPNKLSLGHLVDTIRQSFSTESERCRAAFVWVTENIDFIDTATAARLMERNLEEVLCLRKAWCTGFAGLFAYLCQQLGMETEAITGFADPDNSRTDTLVRNGKLPANHVWCAVKVEGHWRLFDPTWATGIWDEEKQMTIRQFNERYFMIDPRILIYTHLPVFPEWQYLEEPVGLYQFTHWPEFKEDFFAKGITSFHPEVAEIESQDSEVHFIFESETPLEYVIIWSDLPHVQPEKGTLTRSRNRYRYTYRLKDSRPHELYLALNNHVSAIHYRVTGKSGDTAVRSRTRSQR